MRQYEIQNIEKYIAAHRKKRRWLRAMTCLAAVVVFATTYAMMLPALTREIVCPLPEHVHAEECYTRIEDPDSGETVQVLTCGMEEHTHTEECFADAEDPPASQPEETPFAAERASGSLEVSLLYEDESTQEAHPDGWTYWTHEPMEGYLRLEPSNLDTDLTDVTVTLSMPKEYVEKDSIQIPEFSTNSEITRYEILPVEEDGENYRISIHFTAYDKTQTLVLPFLLSFRDDVVPDNYVLPVTAAVSGGSATEPNLYKPRYKPWGIQKFVNSNRLNVFGNDGAEVVVTPEEEGGNPYLSDRTYVDFAFIVNEYTNAQCNLSNYRDACSVTLTDPLPEYTDKDGATHLAVFDADANPGWTLSEDGKSVSRTYTGEHSAEIVQQIYDDQLHLRFPGLAFDTLEDGTLAADLVNTVSLTAVPSGEAQGETHPTAEDPLQFRLTNDPSARGQFTKGALKDDIYDVDVYKTNPYPWSLALSNEKFQPLRHIRIQDRKIVEDGQVVLEGLDEALKFVRLESNQGGSVLPEGRTFADIVDKVAAYYTDGTTEELPVDSVDDSGNFTVTFDEDKVCDGYEIVFADDYEMESGGKAAFTAYTVYRDPENTHVPQGQEKVMYTNTARSENSYQVGEETVTVCLKAGHFYNMFPSTEKLSVQKLTLYNGNGTLLGRGGNHIGDYYLYEIDLTGSLLEPDIKEYQDLRIVDLLPDGIVYDSIYITQGVDGYPILDGGSSYQPEIIEDYHNSGRTALLFHLNVENLQYVLANAHLAKVYFWVKIDESARSGTNTNYVYVVGDNLDDYQGSVGGTADIYDLNNNGRTDDTIAWSSSDANVIAGESTYAEKFIAPAGSDNWNKHGLSMKAGTEFDYLLKITNETAAQYTGVTLCDVLPRIGDQNIFATEARSSEFRVQLRGAIVPPEGYTVLYTTSTEVYGKSMAELAADAVLWTDTVEDYSQVTAFQVAAAEGTVLGGKSSVEVRVPAKAPDSFDQTSMDLLHGKTDSDGSTGTASYLQAANFFGFLAKDLPAPKESNDVWVRVPFAGFQVKKVDAATGEGSPARDSP